MTRRWVQFSLLFLTGLLGVALLMPTVDASAAPAGAAPASEPAAFTQPFGNAEICNCCIASLCPPGLAKVLAREQETFAFSAVGHAPPRRTQHRYTDALQTVPSPPPKA